MTDPFSIENMKAELARAINKQADIQAMILEWSRSDQKDFSSEDMLLSATNLICDINCRNNQP